MVTGQNVKLEDRTVRLGTLEKIGGVLVMALTIGGSAYTSYLVSKGQNEYRLAAAEKSVVELRAVVEQQEKFGHPDHERRITKLEARADGQDVTLGKLTNDVTVCRTILEEMRREHTK